METIKNYLESMFSSLPNSSAVLRAKDELEQMMEDKYNELISAGKAENEAIAIVISEFGNLSDLAETLGIQNYMGKKGMPERRMITLDEARNFLQDEMHHNFLIGLAVFFFINCVTPCILVSTLYDNNYGSAIGMMLLFIFIAIGVGLCVYSSTVMHSWNFLNNQPCSIDYGTADYVHNQKEAYRSTYALLITLGVILCILCFVPVSVLGSLNLNDNMDNFGAMILFILLGLGVMILIIAGGKDKAYGRLLKLNAEGTVGGNYVPSQNEEKHYANKFVEALMSVFWPTITCVYLIWSFLTFDWYITWIIWPIAGVVRKLFEVLFESEE